ncbi:MAG: NUDIX domain-containing protein [Desulfobacterales bacterium]|nr:NUDIX domain-containing protein [Desulfobacterales bacterium]
MNKKLIYKAGIVPYRKKQNNQKTGEIEILIVSSRKYPGQWVFPVGTVEKGESVARAALRECAEESGYNVALGEEIDSFIISSKEQSSKFIFFSGLVMKENKVWEKDRERCWCEINDIVGLVAEPFKKLAEIAIKNLKESKVGK